MLNISMRRALVISGLLLGTTSLFSAKAMADTVNLSGTVTSTLALTTTATTGAGGASALSLDGAAANAETIAQVADLSISTNSEQGYTLTVTSGSLTKSGGTAIPYQVTTTASGTAASSAGFTVASGTSDVYQTSASNAAGTGDRDLWIMYTPAALQDPGSYTGSISVTVADR